MRAFVASFASLMVLGAGACGTETPPSPEEGPLARHARATAAAQHLPGDLLLSIAAVEGGLRLPRFR